MADINFSDVLGLGKGAEKLLDVITIGLGRATKSYFEKKDIETKAKEIREISNAKADAAKLLADAIKSAQQGLSNLSIRHEGIKLNSAIDLPSFLENISLAERAREKSLHKAAIKQINVENITAIAAEQLSGAKDVSDIPVDDGWIHNFFTIAEDISSEEMQLLWGKILAGEINRPRSFSLRTLQFVKNISKDEADTIMKIANFAFEYNKAFYLLEGNKVIMKNLGVDQSDIALLIELGLLHHASPDPKFESRIDNIFAFGNSLIKGTRSDKIPNYPFTKMGNEILKLIFISPSDEYLEHFSSFLGRYETILTRD